MKNPWHEYFNRISPKKLHPQDEAHVISFNMAISSRKNQENIRLRTNLEPLPYLGRPNAPILVLLANPGAGGSLQRSEREFSDRKLELHRKNLLHAQERTIDYVARFESPDDTSLESPYFKKHTKALVDRTSVESVALNIFFVNYHGYQSKAWHPIPFTFPTQRYTFFLVSRAMKNEALIVMSRNMTGWFTAVPGLFDYGNRINFESPRRIFLTEGNLRSSDYDRVLSHLK
jgi:hypothetical protein